MHSATETGRKRERKRGRGREGNCRQQQQLAAGCCLLAGWLLADCVGSVGSTRLPKLVSVSKVWNEQAPGLASSSAESQKESWELRAGAVLCEICECCKCQGKTAAARRSPKKDLEKVEAAGQERSSSGTSRAALAAEVGKTRWVRVETRTRTKFVADVVKNWQQMLLNFKRNFTYLSCGAHSLRCSFERSFRQPTSCCSTLPPLRTPLAAAATLSKLATGHAWRLHQGDFFASPPQLCISSPAFSLHWPYLIIHQNFVGWRGVNLWARPLTLICGRIAASLLLCLCPSLSPAEHSFPAADFHLTCSFRFRFNDALIGLAVCAWRSTPLTVSPLSSLLPFFPSPLPSLSHTLALTNELCFKR